MINTCLASEVSKQKEEHAVVVAREIRLAKESRDRENRARVVLKENWTQVSELHADGAPCEKIAKILTQCSNVDIQETDVRAYAKFRLMCFSIAPILWVVCFVWFCLLGTLYFTGITIFVVAALGTTGTIALYCCDPNNLNKSFEWD